ncbi:MAG: hypothetical protein U5L01_14195, partial [Rheinheimera sp.]|nr:hypothetical protein [Rheinheimera sp.]
CSALVSVRIAVPKGMALPSSHGPVAGCRASSHSGSVPLKSDGFLFQGHQHSNKQWCVLHISFVHLMWVSNH